MSDHPYTNRLINESSPYLLQHAHNPVDWFPWGPEALEKARSEDKPILLSVGYSACHWCHVMEHESFEDPNVAAMMNQDFVSIKVDREERPDIDAIYMQAVQSMTGQGGWPMTVFLTPDGRPFYGGTYFPPEPRHGMPAFTQLLQHIGELWAKRRADVEHNAGQLTDALQTPALTASTDDVDGSLLDIALSNVISTWDRTNGGWGRAPKFPQPQTVDFALRMYQRTGQPEALAVAEHTLDHMARGGIYDQLGGGFHRYSVDNRWLVPHFEKMLYDNAQLARSYLHAYQITQKPMYRDVVTATLDYILREMTSADGGFYATQDADSEGEEGRYYVWSADEVRSVLGVDALRWAQLFDVSPRGNWEGKTILQQPRPLPEVARVLGMDESSLRVLADRGRARLLAAREARVHPGRDEKVLVSWNGLMLAAFAEAGRVLQRVDYVAAARANAAFVDTHMIRDGHLLHVYKDGQARIDAFAADYVHYAIGLLELYRATFEQSYLEQARGFAHHLLGHFWDSEAGGLFQTSDQAEALIMRPKELFDEAVPSANGVAVELFHRLGVLYGEPDYPKRAAAILKLAAPAIPRYPSAFASMLNALEAVTADPQEVAILGTLDAPDTRALLDVLDRLYLPNTAVVLSSGDAATSSALPLLEARTRRDGRATAYVCRAYACQQPTNDAAELDDQLAHFKATTAP
ncbi:MAG: thioredoxin domain-containing protein [Herpetosiphon sp.]